MERKAERSRASLVIWSVASFPGVWGRSRARGTQRSLRAERDEEAIGAETACQRNIGLRKRFPPEFHVSSSSLERLKKKKSKQKEKLKGAPKANYCVCACVCFIHLLCWAYQIFMKSVLFEMYILS